MLGKARMGGRGCMRGQGLDSGYCGTAGLVGAVPAGLGGVPWRGGVRGPGSRAISRGSGFCAILRTGSLVCS